MKKVAFRNVNYLLIRGGLVNTYNIIKYVNNTFEVKIFERI